MSTVETALVSLLASKSGITSLVTATNIYAVFIPAGTTKFPAIAYRRIGGSRETSHDGDTAVGTANFTIMAADNDYLGVCNLATAIRKAVQDSEGTYDGVVIQDIYVTSDGRDGQLVAPENGEFRAFIREVDVTVQYEDPA